MDKLKQMHDIGGIKILLMILMLGSFLILIVGISYAYLSSKATSSDITGVAASMNISVDVEKVVDGGNLIPMKDSDLSKAITHSTACIDNNGFGSCNIYKVTVTNNSSNSLDVSSTIQFTKTGSLDNLKWQELTLATSIGTVTGATNGINATLASTSSTAWRTKDTIASGTNNTKTYYFAVWISNTDIDQTTTDSGSYTATVTFSGGEIKGDVIPNFETDSWEDIATNVANDPTTYEVGATKCVKVDGFKNTNNSGCSNGEFLVRVANNTIPSECNGSGFSQTACGFVVEFVDIITTHNMNSTDTSAGSWESSAMRNYVNGDIYNALPSDLKSKIINTTVVTGHGNGGSSNDTSDKLYLLSPREVWNDSDTTFDSGANNTRQLDWYNASGVTTGSCSKAIKYNASTRQTWWLRAPRSSGSSSFWTVYESGYSYSSYASNAYGVAPAFRIG